MAILVGPTVTKPTHHLSLTDGTTTLGLMLCTPNGVITPLGIQSTDIPTTALQMRQSNGGYDNRELPFIPIVQDDWSGGRGLADFEKDTIRYYDGNAVDTTKPGRVILGPLATYTTGYYGSTGTADKNSTYSVAGTATSPRCVASSVTPAANITVRKARFWVTRSGATNVVIKLRAMIYTDSTGPDTLLAVSDYRTITTSSVAQAIDFDLPETALTASTKYWIALEVETNKTLLAGKVTTAAGNAIYTKTDGAWSSAASNTCIAFMLYTVASGMAMMFEFKRALYAVTKPDDFTTPKLFINGYRGKARAANTDKSQLLTSLNLSGVDLTGCIVRIWSGPGSSEEYPYRVITSNTQTGTNDTITVNPAWKITHSTSTEFVILGCNTWTEVTGHGLTKPVTDVLVADTVVYFAQGEEAYMRRMTYSSGSYTFAADGTNYAYKLAYVINQSGGKKIWRTRGATNDVSQATASTSNLVFGTAYNCGNEDERVTGIIGYGLPPVPYVMKEGSFGSIGGTGSSPVYAEAPLKEFSGVKSDLNGRATLVHNVYLYFSLLDGLERYYNNRLDDIGPNLDEGLPDGRKGPIRHMVGYPGRIYVAIDAGDDPDSTSSVLCYNNTGWHEIYCAPGGKRIRRLYIQTLPGESMDRLWISEEEDLVWLPIIPNPLKDTGYQFAATGSLVTSWMYNGMKDIKKYYDSITVFSENASANQTITVEYQTDDEGDNSDWHAIGTINTSPVQALDIGTYNVSGRRIRLRYTFATTSGLETPVLKATVLDTVERDPVKRGWHVQCYVGDYMTDLHGKLQTADADAVIDQLRTWANSPDTPCPLTLHSNWEQYDGAKVFMRGAPQVRTIEEVTKDNDIKKYKVVVTLDLVEV